MTHKTSKVAARGITSAGFIGAGLLLVESELLAGALIGAGVVYGLPVVGRLLRPIMAEAFEIGSEVISEILAVCFKVSPRMSHTDQTSGE